MTLIITGGLRVPTDFVKAMALVLTHCLSNSAMQAIGCIAARMCNTNNCPAGIATQKEELRKKLDIEKSALQLNNFFSASVELMQVMARACGHDALSQFNSDDLATWNREMALLSGVLFSGFDNSINDVNLMMSITTHIRTYAICHASNTRRVENS